MPPPERRAHFRCKACTKAISASPRARCSPLTSCRSGCYLAAIAIFCNEVKGKSALALTRDLGVGYKSAFVLLHKLREAMAEEMKGRMIGDEGKIAEVDGGYFGGYVKPANRANTAATAALLKNQNGKRKVVVIIRERNGKSLPAVFAR